MFLRGSCKIAPASTSLLPSFLFDHLQCIFKIIFPPFISNIHFDVIFLSVFSFDTCICGKIHFIVKEMMMKNKNSDKIK